MRNLSTEFKEQQNSGNRNYLKYADFTFTDGSTLSITDKDFWSNGFKFEDAVSQSGSFDIGAAIVNKLTLQINNFSGKYTDYIWDGARVVCYIGLELSTGIEKIRICTMTVTDAPYQNTAIISLTCEGYMRKFDRDYSESKLTYPATRLQIIQDACEVCGVTLQSTRFDNDDFIIQNRPNDNSITFRQVIAWVAQMGCQWAKSDEYGRLCLGWYEREVPDKFYNLVETPWKDTDGNDILDTTGAQIITIMQRGITSTDTNGFTPWLYDLEITGVKVTEYVDNSSQNEVKTYQSGKSGYVIEISDNKLVQEGTGAEICQIIADRCVGLKFKPFTTGALTNIAWEAGDAIAISDRNGKEYKSYLTSVTLNPGNFEQLECSAKSVSRSNQKQYTLNQQIQAENKKNLKDERTAREKALEELSQRLAESSGTYTTVETQPDGSNIYYLHNKPNLADSDIVWKMTAEAWAVSTDGGQHWNGGMTVDGDVIARILTATGINADWIKTGALVIRDNNGKIIFSADITNHQLIMDGSSIRIGESPLDNLLNDMQGQIDGNINTWTGTSAPTLSNYPANEWLDDTEMSKHVGDIYYDGNSHAYRFVNEGSGYYWKRLKDTDVTKALQDSEEALSAAKQAQEAAAFAKNMTLQLSNEYQGISVDSDGNYGTFPSKVTTQAVVMYGTQDITEDCDFTIVKSDGVTGSWNNSTKTYTVTGLSTDDGWVDVKATYISVLSVTKRFSISKIYAGGKGEKGDPGVSGKTTHLHIAYADSADGKEGFSLSVSEDKSYIGQYTDFEETGSTDPTKYSWTLIKGSPGKDGSNGKDSYTWIRYASMPDGSDMSDFADRVPWLDSNGDTITDTNGDTIYLVPDEVAYIGIAENKDTPVKSNNPLDYAWSRYRGSDGKDGKDGIPGKNGADGRTSYTHIAYANSDDGQTDFSLTDSDREYIGMYVDFELKGSTNPEDYRWTKVRGADGKVGTPGKPGEDGRTPYFHVAYANSADGKNGFDVSDSVGKEYIGQYTDYTEADSTNPEDYSWTKIKGEPGEKGEQGVPGRTFFIQLSANVLKRGQNNAVTPATLTANAFYRDGDSAARYPYEGRWKIETSTDGVSYTEVSVSTENESIKSYLVGSLQKDIVSVRFTLYEAGGTEHPLDMQSAPIVIDVDNLTHEEIFNLFTDNGKYKGIYKQGNLLLMNADYIKSGILKGIKLETVTGDITGEFTSTSTNSWGKEYVKIKDAIITAGLDGTQKSLIDMVAQYGDGSLHLVIKNDTEINIEAPVLKILTDILNIGDGQISITQKSLAEAQVNVANTDISGRLVASGGKNFGLYNVTSGSWVIKSDATGNAVLPNMAVTSTTDEVKVDISNASMAGRLTISNARNFGLYHMSLKKWLIRMDINGVTHLLNTIFDDAVAFNESATFYKSTIFNKPATFNDTASFKKPPKLYKLAQVTSGGHIVFAADGETLAWAAASSMRYKEIGKTIEEADLEELYQIKVVWAKYKNEYLDASDERYGKEMPMFLAEDIDQHFPLAVDHDEQGRAENWNYRVMIPCMFAMLKNEHEKVIEVKRENENLKSELQSIKDELKELKQLLMSNIN